MKRIILFSLGILLILVGIVGLFLPILQGWAMIFLGLTMVSPRLAAKLRGRAFRHLFKKEIVELDEWKKIGRRAGFTTRHFPLKLERTDDLLEIENQNKFKALMPDTSRFVLLNQVHGEGIAVLDAPEDYQKQGVYHFAQCDAAITKLKGITLLVFSADCLSVFISAGEWVGLVHAGWKGSQKKITQKTLKLIAEKAQIRPEEVKVIFGPCLSAKHYEVGQEFRGFFPASSLAERKGKLYFNIAGENKRQLLEAGVLAENMIDLGICTVEENSNFYSFRKEKASAARIISFISRS